MTSPARVTYLTFDSVLDGVGASQVLPYVERVARRGIDVELHSFEQRAGDLVAPAGVTWHRHAFGRPGSLGGLQRVAAGAMAIRRGEVVHARSDLAAASALVARPDAWLWDVRSFWVDQRIAMGLVRAGSLEERAMRRIESAAARCSSAIVTLTEAAIDELGRRHGDDVAAKARVVSTCVDLDRFSYAPMPMPAMDSGVRLLLSGSFNPLYDLPTMLRFSSALRSMRPATLTLLRPSPSPWDRAVADAGGTVASSSFAAMPEHVRAHSAGLSVCRTNHPAALTGAMPTKIAELLACGRPVVVNAGLGDCDRLLRGAGAGVVLEGTSDGDIARGCEALLALLDDPGTPARCRALAERHFDIERGVDALVDCYRALGAGPASEVVG